MSVSHLFHVMTLAYNGGSSFQCKVIYPSRTYNVVSSSEYVWLSL